MPPAPVLTNPRAERVRSVRALARRAIRERRGQFVVEGPQAVRELLTWRPELACEMFLDQEAARRHTALVDLAGRLQVRLTPVTAEVLAVMADTGTPQGVLAVCRPVATPLRDVLALQPSLVVVLAAVRDPGNAGTAIRAADAAGADAVVVTDGSVDVHNPKVVRSTAGSLFHVPIVAGVLVEQVLAALRGAGLRILAADAHGPHDLWSADLTGPHAWVLGNEAWGLAASTVAGCDDVVRVPILGRAESLNLAMAATVCVYASARAQQLASSRKQTDDSNG